MTARKVPTVAPFQDDVQEPDEEWWLPRRRECWRCDHTWIASALRPRCPACGFDGLAMERE